MDTFKVGDRVRVAKLPGIQSATGVVCNVFQSLVDVNFDKPQGKVTSVLTDPGNVTLLTVPATPVKKLALTTLIKPGVRNAIQPEQVPTPESQIGIAQSEEPPSEQPSGDKIEPPAEA
jgi:hypothetical protein